MVGERQTQASASQDSAEHFAAREYLSARSPVVGVLALGWAAVSLGTSVAHGVYESHDAVRIVVSGLFTLFPVFVGLAYFQQPGSAPRKWMWRAAWAAIALHFLGVGIPLVANLT